MIIVFFVNIYDGQIMVKLSYHTLVPKVLHMPLWNIQRFDCWGTML